MAFDDVLGDIGSLANPFGPNAKNDWNLSRGVYYNSLDTATIFFYETTKGENITQRTAIDQINNTGGRRVAIYEYPYIDGQKTDDLGRKGEIYNFNIKFFGPNHQQKLIEFIDNVINDPGPGTLLHPTLSPVRGSIPCRFRDYEIINRYDEFNATTIRATWVEDNTGEIVVNFNLPASQDSILRKGLQILTNVQSLISTALLQVGALLALPGAVIAAFKARFASIVSSWSQLQAQIAATFSHNSKTVALAAQSASITGGIPSLTSGTVTTTSPSNVSSNGVTITAQLPPVYQVGFDPVTLASIQAEIQNFINANQITAQQVLYLANQIRQLISEEIALIQATYGNQGYGIILEYRTLANSIQEVVQTCVGSTQTQVIPYVVPYTMSLRQIAVNNGLTTDRQNDIASLNPDIPSVNFVIGGTTVMVPAS